MEAPAPSAPSTLRGAVVDARHRRTRCEHTPPRRLHHRGGTLGLHLVPRLRGRVPGLDRPARDHQRDAPQPRAHRVAIPRGVQPAFEAMERNGVPWAFQPADRARWADGLDIPTMAELAARGERPRRAVLGRLHGLVRRPREEDHRRLRAIMQAAGVRFAILGQEESCNGDPARRMGNEYLYQMLAKQAIETLDTLPGDDRSSPLPALLPPDGQRVPAARRALRGDPPLHVHRAAARRGPRAAATPTRGSAHDGLPRQLLPRPLQRRVRRAARDTEARAPGGDAGRAARARATAASAAAPAAGAC